MAQVAAVIGGAGAMGEWFARFLKGHGYKVVISDIDAARGRKIAAKLGVRFLADNKLAAAESNLVVIATPPERVREVLKEIADGVQKDTSLVEISSIKSLTFTALEKAARHGFRVFSIHPMFGPGTVNLQGKRLILVSVKGSNNGRFFLKAFRGSGVKIVKVDWKKHDRYMGVNLALPQFLNLLFAYTLLTSGMNLNDVKHFAGTTFDLQLLLSECVLQGSLEMYSAIQFRNKSSLQAIKSLVKNANRIFEMLQADDLRGFEKAFRKSRNYLSKDVDYEAAYNRFNRAHEALVMS